MAVLSDRDRREVERQLQSLAGSVKLINFTQELACQYCRETELLLREVADLSGKISLEVYNFQLDKEKVAQYRVDKIPATIVNETGSIEGALPEAEFVEAIIAAARRG